MVRSGRRRRRALGAALGLCALVGGLGAHALPAVALPAAPVPDTPSATTPAGPETAATGAVIVRFKPGTAPAISSAARDRALSAAGPADVDLDAARTLATGATLVTGATPDQAVDVAADLRTRADVAYAEPDIRLTVHATDRFFSSQWDLRSSPVGIGAAEVWDRTQGEGVVVAVIDSGIVEHPDLAGQVLPGYDFISDARTARDGGGRDADPSDTGDWQALNECAGDPSALPSTWHGTHVAGTIAALAHNGIGVAGVAPKASILPVRAIGRCGGSLSDIADGLTWASGGKVTGVPANRTPARVVNLSVGGRTACPKTLQAAITGAVARGTIVVTASGNDGLDARGDTPGNCTGVLNVVATAGDGSRAPYSNYGPNVGISAPGGAVTADAILSTVDRGRRGPTGPGYGLMVGTSMAAPHVSGVAALLLAAEPSLTPAQLRQLLVSTAKPFPRTCGGCGSGIVDAPAALAALTDATKRTTKSTTKSGTRQGR